MTFGLGRGLNRLFLTLTVAWAIYCAVLYPVQRQWETQNAAFVRNRDENKNCDQLIKEAPGWSMTKDCYQRAATDLQVELEDSSLGHFWIWDALLWKLLIPAVVLPPVIIYAIAMIGKWVGNGFNLSSNG